MFKKIKNYFGLKPKVYEEPFDDLIEDPDFGLIGFCSSNVKGIESIWQTEGEDWVIPEHNAKLSFSAIPGDKNGPFEYSRKFFLDIRTRLDDVWKICEDSLRIEIEKWHANELDKNPKSILFLSSIALENDKGEWEATFQSKGTKNSTWIHCQIVDNKVVSTVVDT